MISLHARGYMLVSQSLFPHSLFQLNYLSTQYEVSSFPQEIPSLNSKKFLFISYSTTSSRDAQRAQIKPCVHEGAETPQRLSQSCRCVFECLLWSHKSAVVCRGDRGSGCSRPGTCSVWHKPSWRKSPLAPP